MILGGEVTRGYCKGLRGAARLEGQVGGTRMDMTPNQQRGQSSPY